jgi:guanylate kinase
LYEQLFSQVEFVFDLEPPPSALHRDGQFDPRICDASAVGESAVLADWLQHQLRPPALVFVVGGPQSGRRKYARAFAERTGAVHIDINGNAALDIELPAADVLRLIRAEMHAKRPHCIVVSGFPRNVCDAVVVDGGLRHRSSLETIITGSSADVLVQRLSKLGLPFSSALEAVNRHLANIGPLEAYLGACSDRVTRVGTDISDRGCPEGPEAVAADVVAESGSLPRLVFVIDAAASGTVSVRSIATKVGAAYLDLRALLDRAQQNQTLEGQISTIAPLVGSSIPCALLAQLLQAEIHRATADIVFVNGFPMDEDQARAALLLSCTAASMLLLEHSEDEELSPSISGALRVFLEQGRLFRAPTGGSAAEVVAAVDQQLSAMRFGVAFPLLAVAGPDHCGKRDVLAPLLGGGRVTLVESVTTSERAVSLSSEPMRWVAEDDFEALIRDRQLVEYIRVHGVYFGTPLEAVQRASLSGKLPLLFVNHHRACAVRACGIPCVLLALAPLSLTELETEVSQIPIRPVIRDELQRVAREELGHISHQSQVYDCVMLNREAAGQLSARLSEHPLVRNAESCKRFQ